jgi:hypothetical protein
MGFAPSLYGLQRCNGDKTVLMGIRRCKMRIRRPKVGDNDRQRAGFPETQSFITNISDYSPFLQENDASVTNSSSRQIDKFSFPCQNIHSHRRVSSLYSSILTRRPTGRSPSHDLSPPPVAPTPLPGTGPQCRLPAQVPPSCADPCLCGYREARISPEGRHIGQRSAMRPIHRQWRRHRRGEVARGERPVRLLERIDSCAPSATATGTVYLSTLATHLPWQQRADDLLWRCLRGHPPQGRLYQND